LNIVFAPNVNPVDRTAPSKKGPDLKVWVTPQFAKLPSDHFFVSWRSESALWVRINVSSKVFSRSGSFRLPEDIKHLDRVQVTAFNLKGSTKIYATIPNSSLAHHIHLEESRKVFNPGKQSRFSAIALVPPPRLPGFSILFRSKPKSSRIGLKTFLLDRCKRVPSGMSSLIGGLNHLIRRQPRDIPNPKTDYFDID
jgi:hypothetical protein